MKIFVEGSGDSNALKTACRKGFRKFLEKSGLKNQPRILACGSRQSAYDDFCTAIENGEAAMLLVDSETPVSSECQQGEAKDWQPWQHLADRTGDQWQKPEKSSDQQCHLMVQCMEAWVIADRQTLARYFGQGFKENALPATQRPIESVAKADLYNSLKTATKECKTKSVYGKGEHSFELLAQIDPGEVIRQSAWANRFVQTLKSALDG
jgi:hypothetical protein